MLPICPVDRDSHRPRLRGHFHHDVCPTFGQGFRIAIRGPNHPDCIVLQGGHDRAERGSTKKGGYGHTLPQHESGSLAGGRAGAESVADRTEGSSSWQGTF
jgi:hypothetical protein